MPYLVLAELDTMSTFVAIGSGVVTTVLAIGAIIWSQGRRDAHAEHLAATLEKVASSLDRVAEATNTHSTAIAVHEERISWHDREIKEIKESTGIKNPQSKRSG